MMDKLSVPQDFITSDFELVREIHGVMGEEDIILYRYQRAGIEKLFDEHISFVISAQRQLKGFVRLTKDFITQPSDMPSAEHSQDVATNFLSSYASDLSNNMEVHWIKQHDEKIVVNGSRTLVSGMKVKCRDMNTGKYFWVVVGANDEVLIFERDIVWDFLRAGRQTEKWLHDSWLKSQL